MLQARHLRRSELADRSRPFVFNVQREDGKTSQVDQTMPLEAAQEVSVAMNVEVNMPCAQVGQSLSRHEVEALQRRGIPFEQTEYPDIDAGNLAVGRLEVRGLMSRLSAYLSHVSL